MNKREETIKLQGKEIEIKRLKNIIAAQQVEAINNLAEVVKEKENDNQTLIRLTKEVELYKEQARENLRISMEIFNHQNLKFHQTSTGDYLAIFRIDFYKYIHGAETVNTQFIMETIKKILSTKEEVFNNG